MVTPTERLKAQWDHYLDRKGYGGDREASYSFLEQLSAAGLIAFPTKADKHLPLRRMKDGVSLYEIAYEDGELRIAVPYKRLVGSDGTVRGLAVEESIADHVAALGSQRRNVTKAQGYPAFRIDQPPPAGLSFFRAVVDRHAGTTSNQIGA